MPHLRFASRLAAPPERVWQSATSPLGINHELMPLMRMTFPHEVLDLNLATVKVGQPICTSFILLFGVLPIDRSRVTLKELGPGHHFIEESPLLSMRLWRHERTVTPVEGGSELEDDLTFEPRVALLGPAVTRLIGTIFRHRHGRLQEMFGRAPA